MAFAETVLHDELPENGRFVVTPESLECRFVVAFSGKTLKLADLTGPGLKLSGIDGSVSSIDDYHLPQRWSVAIYKHPLKVDGILYMSRHMNSGKSVVLFDRAKRKLKSQRYVPFLKHPDSTNTVLALHVTYA